MDYDLFVRYMKAGRFARVNRFLAVFRQRDQAKTSTLLETVGREEIRKVWLKYELQNHRFDNIRSSRFMNGALRNGSAYAQSGKSLPGALSGVGYDYGDVWAGLYATPACRQLNTLSRHQLAVDIKLHGFVGTVHDRWPQRLEAPLASRLSRTRRQIVLA